MQFVSTFKINPLLLFLFCCILYSFLASNHVMAQSGKITGTVKEELSGDPLPGANCALIGTALGAATDLSGEYSILIVPPGSYTLRVMYLGYTQEELYSLFSEKKRKLYKLT